MLAYLLRRVLSALPAVLGVIVIVFAMVRLAPGDPALLQERAEAAILLSDFERADGLAARAQALGPGVGPLCRRHWATREQVRLVRGDAAGAAAARDAIEVCTVAPPPRW